MRGYSTEVEKCLQDLGVLISNDRQLQVEEQVAKSVLDDALHKLYALKYSGKITKRELDKCLMSELNEFQNSCDGLNRSQVQVVGERAKLEASLYESCKFKSSSITKYLAEILSRETNQEWLPIRYLLSAPSNDKWQKEAYGVVLAEALLSIENITDTITLLNTPHFVPLYRYGIKYTETSHPEMTIYSKTHAKNVGNIWYLSSYNFLSIAGSKEYNALFDVNVIKSKPFLHLPLKFEEQKIIHKVDSYNTYKNYTRPHLSDNHPRIIALNAVANLVDNRIREQKYEFNTTR